MSNRLYLGISGGIGFQRQSPAAVPAMLWSIGVATGGTLAHLPGRLADVARSTIAGTPRGRNDPVSIVGVGRLGGEITSSNLPGLRPAEK